MSINIQKALSNLRELFVQNAEKKKLLSSSLTFSLKCGILLKVWKAIVLDKFGGVWDGKTAK